MFDLFGSGVTPEKFNELSNNQATGLVAIAIVLTEKGIATDAELANAHTRARAMVDQMFQEKLDEQRRELENDKTYQLFSKLFKPDA